MKKLFAAVACGWALPTVVTPALADGPFSLKDTPVQVQAPTWSGVYFGVGAGYGHNHSKNNYRDSDGETSSRNESASGGIVSLIYGIDRQIGSRFVVGAFADISTSELNRGDFDIGNGMTVDRSWAIGARAGLLVNDRTLVYATAGYTQAHFSNEGWWDIDVGPTTLPGRGGQTFGGYFVGGGIERQLNESFYLRGEARYSDFSGKVTNSGSFEDVNYVDREVPSIVTVQAALVYKLDREKVLRPDPVTEDRGPKVITYSGIDAAHDSVAYYGGTIFGLSGDLYKNGVLLRTQGIIADYDYRAGEPIDRTVDADDRSLDVMLGYQWVFSNWSAAAYLGYEVRSVHLSPRDLDNDVRGGADGFKVAVELETESDGPFYGSLEGSYSTAFNSFFAEARAGYNFKRFIVGPASSVYSDEGDVATRVGAFTTIPFNLPWNGLPAKLTFDVGHQFVSSDSESRAGGEGIYGGSMLRIDF
ncbi:cellulose biosynthesis protein BcsS [Hyphomicrobium sp.]|uniref:cellulose biosynthesis protein BcsS n=1 Tax=Hyphomicrobium sp. TaxID=82 RepID=UPI002D76E684|nr:cellulose biosynthesis protein BcsS [Hyphomicrobium sp.]HET6391068.1 cellulose biosynthesis protein BcsS [Hyphomicrobium sp.]